MLKKLMKRCKITSEYVILVTILRKTVLRRNI